MAVQTNAIAGIASISVNGRKYLLNADCKYSTGTYERETLVGMDQVHGFSAKPHVPFISATLRNVSGLSVDDLTNMENVTVHLDLINKKQVTGRNMWQTGAIEVDAGDGSIGVRFEGYTGSVEEI